MGPKQLDNPEFVEEVYPFDDIGAVGFELWTVNNGSIFDNILLCDSYDHAKSVGEKLKKDFFEKEKDAKKAWDKATGKDTGDSTDASAGAGGEDDDDDDDDDAADAPKEDL